MFIYKSKKNLMKKNNLINIKLKYDILFTIKINYTHKVSYF